ncbi:MAG TPA: amidohydrolase family protein, partial [Acidimicrobiales bacterium]
MAESARYTVISADTHGGGNMAAYREHLDPDWRDEFDAWRGDYQNPFRDLQGDGRSRNWDSERRLAEQEADGVVAEVVFPNTVPPFFPTGALVARPPTPEELPRRLAGIRAHNRWMAEWCAEQPVRRAGMAQIFLNDLDEAIADVGFAAEHGLRGGVLLPAVPPDVPHIDPLYAETYDPLWAACDELGVVVNHHSGGGSPDYGRHRATGMVWIAEA